MDERHKQQEAAREDMREASRDEARAEAWLDDAMWHEEEAEAEAGGGFPPWMGPWGKRRRPVNNYPYDPYDPYDPSRRHHHRDREYTSGWWIVFWVFLAIILLAILTPSVGTGVSVIGSSFTAVLGLVILFLAVWKVVDLIRYR